MEKQNKRKMSFKRFKRICKSVFKELGNSFKSLIDRFNKLPKHIKTITYVWGIVIIIIFILIVATTNNNKHLEVYHNMENVMVDATLEYVSLNDIYPVKESKLKLDKDTLEEFGKLDTSDLNNKKCNGFTVTYYDEDTEEYNIKAFINCDNYTTKEYSDYK